MMRCIILRKLYFEKARVITEISKETGRDRKR